MATYVLVHGAWHDPECWARVIPLLADKGHRVFTPSLTGYGDRSDLLSPEVGLDTHIQDVTRLLVEQDLADVVLVGHSYAGMVISGVADQLPERIGHLVYLAAIVPMDGESVNDTLSPEVRRVLFEVADEFGDGWRVPPPPEQPLPVGLFGVTDPQDKTWLRTLLSDQPIRCVTQPVRLGNPAADGIPRSHIHCTVGESDDLPKRPVPAVQPNGSPSRVWHLATGHDCMITCPQELTDLLLRCIPPSSDTLEDSRWEAKTVD